MSRHLPVPCAFQETLCSQMTHSCSFPGSCPASDHAEPPSHALWGQRSARRAPRRCGNCASPTLGWRGAWSRGRRLQPCVIPHPPSPSAAWPALRWVKPSHRKARLRLSSLVCSPLSGPTLPLVQCLDQGLFVCFHLFCSVFEWFTRECWCQSSESL